MKQVEIAREVIIKHGGIAKTNDLNNAGLKNYEISQLCKNGQILRIKHGYYQLSSNKRISDLAKITFVIPDAIICMDSALYFYNYSRYVPDQWNIAIPRGFSRSKLQIDDISLKPYFINDDFYELGITTEMFQGTNVKMYNRERTICDCFKYRNKMNPDLFSTAIHAYAIDNNKDLPRLLTYAKKMRVLNKMNNIMAVVIKDWNVITNGSTNDNT